MVSSVNNSRRIILQLSNRKFAKKAIFNRGKMRKFSSTSLSNNIFTKENLILRNIKIAFLWQKRADYVEKKFTRNGTVYISSPDIQRGKVLRI